ncbi:MAG TPA: hypothetical protein VKN36_11340 [Eudoraea sp.]|nr:hypothetical protein [Eudoraea sp.]
MTNQSSVKPPVWFWIVSVLALIWNLMGVMAYLQDAFTTVEQLGAMTQDERFLFESRPAWVTAAFAIAVWGGALGCIILLLRKKWAKAVLIISLFGILAQMAYVFFMSTAIQVYGQLHGLIMPLVVIVVGIALVFLARMAHRKGWLS